jgi:calcium-dependent protein kinase
VRFTLDDFEFVNYISKGSFGSVFKVYSKTLRKFYAAKVIAKCFLKDESDVVSLKSEIEITREVDHPYVMKVIDILSDSRFIQIINELVPGGSFSGFINEQNALVREQHFFL